MKEQWQLILGPLNTYQPHMNYGDFPTLPAGSRLIDGLPVVNAWICTTCPYVHVHKKQV